jgi:hypothetical protein
MNTYTLEQIRRNADLLFSSSGNEPVLLKKGEDEIFLIMPLQPEKLEEIFMLYAAIKNQIVDNDPLQKKVSFREFDKKWGGFIKDVQLSDNWRDDYINEKMEKHQ